MAPLTNFRWPLRRSRIVGSGNPITRGLVGYWKFDEISGVARDSSGYGNNGVYSGSFASTNVPSVLARSLYSRRFNGSTDNVTIFDSPSLRPANFTICLWVNPAIISGADLTELIHKICTASSANSYALWINTTGKLFFEIASSASHSDLNGNAILTVGRWWHISASYNGASMQLYVNGSQDSSSAQAITLGYDTNPVIIAAHGPFNLNFPGLMDDVRIYNRALLLSEIAQIASGNG